VIKTKISEFRRNNIPLTRNVSGNMGAVFKDLPKPILLGFIYIELKSFRLSTMK
jgi:hypothetical protein